MAERGKITEDMVVNDTIRLYPETIGVFTKFDIDSCCDGAPLAELLNALNEAAPGN
jgi:iron-sulfur cluster repair protein YtfE (RIC family)